MSPRALSGQPSPLTTDSFTVIVAVLGTTISPYMFFWQSSQEVEELDKDPRAKALAKAPAQARGELAGLRLDTLAGMAASNIVAMAIMISTAATLHLNGKTHIATAADAAEALRPVAGDFAFVLFCLGIVGTGLLAVPVLAGSAAYAIGECKVGNAALRTSRGKPWVFMARLQLPQSWVSASNLQISIPSARCFGAR